MSAVRHLTLMAAAPERPDGPNEDRIIALFLIHLARLTASREPTLIIERCSLMRLGETWFVGFWANRVDGVILVLEALEMALGQRLRGVQPQFDHPA